MGKLKVSAPALTRLAIAVPYLNEDAAQASRVRDQTATWRAWYKTARWQKMRWQVLVAALFTCVRCKVTQTSPNLVADHIKPHRGNAALFWNERNLQCLCKPCHDIHKQREERSGGG